MRGNSISMGGNGKTSTRLAWPHSVTQPYSEQRELETLIWLSLNAEFLLRENERLLELFPLL